MEEGKLTCSQKSGGRRGCSRDSSCEVRVWTGSPGSALLRLRDSREPGCCGSRQFRGPAGVELKCPLLQPLDRARRRATCGRRKWKDCYLGKLVSLKTAMYATFRGFSEYFWNTWILRSCMTLK